MKQQSTRKWTQIGAMLTLGASLLTSGIIGARAQGAADPDTPVNLTGRSVMKVNPKSMVGIDQRLDNPVPLDIPFADETGKTVQIGDLLNNKPAILVMPFYKCGGACTLELNELGKSMLDKSFKFVPGKDFNIITVSIDAKEKPELALAKKNQYLQQYPVPNGEAGWHFLTGSQDSINRLCQAVGFRYVYDGTSGQPVHAAGLIYLTPKGHVARYFMGAVYRPNDLRLSLIETSENRIGSLAEKLVLYCVHFDAVSGRYSVTIMSVVKIAFIGTTLLLLGFVWVNRKLDKKLAQKNGSFSGPTPPTASAQA